MSLKKTQTFELSNEEIQEQITKLENFELAETPFKFLNAHKGLRKQSIHLLVAHAGSGKTSLVRSMVRSLAAHHKVLLWASEENKNQIEVRFSQKFKSFTEIRSNISLITDKRIKELIGNNVKGEEMVKQVGQQIRWAIKENQAEVLIFDNITTSVFYDCMIETSTLFIAMLKELAEEMNIPVFIIAHVESRQKLSYFKADSIRGNKGLVNVADYTYCFYKFVQNSGFGIAVHPIIFVEKSRHHDEAVGRHYLLVYDQGVYTEDSEISFETVKRFYKESDRL